MRVTTALLSALALCALPCACDSKDAVIAIWAPPGARSASGAGSGGAGAGGGGGAAGALASGATSGATDAAAGSAVGPSADAASAGDAGQSMQPAAFYVEAEAGQLTGALTVGESAEASGGQYIEATEAAPDGNAPGTAVATFAFTLSRAGDYILWGRIHAPDATQNRFWFRVDRQIWFLWRISTGDAWFWDDLHNNTDYNTPLVFPLLAGPHQLEIANAVTGAQLDELYITSAGDHPPGNTTPCSPPHSIELNGTCVRSCGSYGAVTCDPTLCATRPTIDVYDCAVCCLQ